MPSFRLDRFLTLCFFHPLIRRKGPVDAKKIPILMYHSISDDNESTTHPYYHINTTPAVFTEQMRFLSENDYSVVDLHDLKNCFDRNNNLTRKFVVITFDDGYLDFYTNAFPILQKYHFPATVFLPTDFINENRKTFKDKECLAWAEVRELHNKGISFGSHTLSHSQLYRLPWEKVRQELVDSRFRIEDDLHAPVTSFCYPYAFPQEDRDFVLRFKHELVDQGYRFAVNTVIGRAGRESDLLSLARLPVNQGDDEKLFKAKLLGRYDWMAGAQAIVRRIKFHLRIAEPDDS
jgi:peptidoglycan/xylan/chitin deacetylase (PgdA/CDA1 family)